MSKRKQTTVKRDTGNKGDVVVLIKGPYKRSLSVEHFMIRWNVTFDDARFLLRYFKPISYLPGSLDIYNHLSKADINYILSLR